MVTLVYLHLYAHYFVHEDVRNARGLSTNVTMSMGFWICVNSMRNLLHNHLKSIYV